MEDVYAFFLFLLKRVTCSVFSWICLHVTINLNIRFYPSSTQVPHSRAYAGLDDDEEDQKRSAPDAELEAVLAAHRTAR